MKFKSTLFSPEMRLASAAAFWQEEIKRPRSASEVAASRTTVTSNHTTRFFGSTVARKKTWQIPKTRRKRHGIPVVYLVVTSMSNDSDRCHKKVNDCPSYAISLEGTETSRATYLTTKESSQKKMASHLETGHSGHKKTA